MKRGSSPSLFLSLFFIDCMKYSISSDVIPFANRKAVNDRILLLINSGKAEQVGKEAIFNAYTGDGGLHGLNFSEFDNYSSFSKAKKEIENGQFFTPASICEQMVACVPVSDRDLVADLTCGMGNFFNFLPVEHNLYGCELDSKSCKVAMHLYPFAQIEHKDLRYYKPAVKFDVIFGNPPFNLDWSTDKGPMKSQLYFMLKASETLTAGGILVALVPNSFLADEFFNKKDVQTINEEFSFLGQTKLADNAFAHIGVSNFPCKIMFFQKRFEGIPAIPYSLSYIDFDPQQIKANLIEPALEYKKQVAKKATLAERIAEKDWSFANDSLRRSDGFEFQVKKYLYEIKKHRSLQSKYRSAIEYINRFKTEEQPEGMKYEEWQKIRLTPAKVLAYLRGLIKRQNKATKSGYSVYSTSNGITFHAHDAATGKWFNELKVTNITWIDLLQGKASLEEHPLKNDLFGYKKLLRRKQRLFDLCQTDIFETEVPGIVKRFVNDYTFLTPENEVAKLTDIQNHDVCKILPRPYAILSWEQGCGKTVSGYTAIRYGLEVRKLTNVFVIGPPLATEGTWAVFLKRQKANFIYINKISDINKIQPGQIVVVAITLLNRVKKQLRSYLKKIHQKAILVFDESDEITNGASLRSELVRNIFRRLKVKLLTTGTTTRNNIPELYGQLELLYNNSFNFICDCNTIYFQERYVDKDGISQIDIISKSNKRVGMPFPPKGGLQLFKTCYSPSKATVFGLEKLNQDLYNHESLIRLTKRTIITRKFKEIAGDDRYEIHTHKLEAKPFERELFVKIMDEFNTIVPHYYASTGNARKDAMFKILRQIQLSIKSCSLAHKMTGTNEPPAKAPFIAKLIGKYPEERILVGCTTIEAVEYYTQYLQNQFPFRKVFFVSGETHSVAKRKEVVNQFRVSDGGILVCTQQSLKSSIDIPECNRVICESMQYNIPKMSQFYFRAIRFTSKKKTNVHFILYTNSIEVNLMGLLTAKERLNDFIKTNELRERAAVMEEFDLDENFFDMLLSKIYDKDGNVTYSWGKQKMLAA